MSPTLEKLGVSTVEVLMPQILEASAPDVLLAAERKESPRDGVVILDLSTRPTDFVVEWQISEPGAAEVPHS